LATGQYLGKAGAAPAIHERESDLQSDGFADSLLTLTYYYT